MIKCLISFLSLSLARLSLLCLRSLFLLGGRETVSSRTSFFCILFLGTGLQTLEREVISRERLELYQDELLMFSRGARARITRLGNWVIPGHCLIIPGHYLGNIPGHWVMLFCDDCWAGCDTRRLLDMGVMDLEEATLMQR